MRLVTCTLLCAGVLGLCLAVPQKTIRWCTVSHHEAAKCSSFQDKMKMVLPEDGPFVTCVNRTSYLKCIGAIAEDAADAMTIDGGWLYEASLPPYNLKPVAVEFHGSKTDPQTHHYVVAIAKKGTNFQLSQLQGKKPCLPGTGQAAEWKLPISIQLPEGPKEEAVNTYLFGNCLPCVDKKLPYQCNLCSRTGTDTCACSSHEPYFGSDVFKCLEDGVGDVGFMKHLTMSEVLPQEANRAQYELLCLDDTRRPVDEYERCHLAQVPSHAVVARSVDGKEDLIWELLSQAQENFGKSKSSEFQLFGSPQGKDLLFTDAAHGFLRVPRKMDAKMYLGYEYLSLIRRLKGGVDNSQRVQWCAVGQHERAKCDQWSAVSGGGVVCTTQETPEDCIAAITKGDADAMSLDPGFVYTSGQCGLVPVLAENYKATDGRERLGSRCVNAPLEGYYAVAVVKKADVNITWNSLRGKKSCHTAVGTAAGWHVPIGVIASWTSSCRIDDFFSKSCAPGADPYSHLCALCDGSNPIHTCAPNSHQIYYGSSGALRCLVEKGDVAFVDHLAVPRHTDGRNLEPWAKDLKKDDFQLLCPDGTRKAVTEAPTCYLAKVPNRAVVSRKDKADFVRGMLFNQQELFGRNGFEYLMFQLFESSNKDLLFRDDTECLSNLQNKTTYETYLGPEYLTALAEIKQCTGSELVDACTFQRN